MDPRRFEKAGGGRTLFWEVRLQDRFVSLAWGEVGGARKMLDRNCGTADAARAKLDQLIAQQREDGYVEVDLPSVQFDPSAIDKVLAFEGAPAAEDAPPPKPVLVFASSPELELQCRTEADDPGLREIYGDWLISHGDLRGEIAALRRNHKDREANILIAKHYDALFGEHATLLRDIASDLEWRHGFLVGACLHADPSNFSLDGVTRGLLAAPVATFVEKLRFGLSGNGNNNWGPTLRAVALSAQGPFIRELRFDAEEETEVSWILLGNLDGWSAFPRLERLRFRAGEGGTLGTLELPALRSFEYESCAITPPEIESIAKARWPKLSRLELWLGAQERGAIETIVPLRPILDGIGLPELVHLGLCNTELLDDLIPALADSKVLPQLTSLDLRHGTLVSSDELVRRAAAFRHLTSLSLQQNLLSDVHCERIQAVLPNAKVDDQRYDDYEGEDEDQIPRYVALWE